MKINTIKRLYHGTDREFERFEFNFARAFKDFGKGFYLTSNFWQAQKWAQNKASKKIKTYIYSYCIDTVVKEKLNVLELLQYDKNWVDFIRKSRMDGMETNYDVIYDRIADNQYLKISEVLQKYIDNEMTSDHVIDKIKWSNNADQYCFKNERALKLLKDRKIIVQYKDENGIWKQEKDGC